MTRHKSEQHVNDVYAYLHMRVKAEADKKSLTVRDLTAFSTLPEERLRAIFDGRAREITLRELAALSMALDIPITDLLSPL